MIGRIPCLLSRPNAVRMSVYVYVCGVLETDMRVDSCKVLKDKMPGTDIDFSDHFGVEAKMAVKRNITGEVEAVHLLMCSNIGSSHLC